MQGLQGPKHLLQPGQALLLLQVQEQQRRSPLQALQVQGFPLALVPLLPLLVLLQGERPAQWPQPAGQHQFPLALLVQAQVQLELLRSQQEPLQRRPSNPLLALRRLRPPLRLRPLQPLR